MVLMKSDAVTYTWVDNFCWQGVHGCTGGHFCWHSGCGTAQVGMEDRDMAPDSLEVGKVQSTYVGKAQGTQVGKAQGTQV